MKTPTLIRHFPFLVALEREKHFARAAAYCKLSQPTLSAQNRRIIEGAFRGCGISSHVVFEANDL
ncbi:MAG: hypothetical protein ORN98_04215 [Alphaproteobacteria bacterium]|nr:hypothetical protein [Alphaproteobacteria bacterium]